MDLPTTPGFMNRIKPPPAQQQSTVICVAPGSRSSVARDPVKTVATCSAPRVCPGTERGNARDVEC